MEWRGGGKRRALKLMIIYYILQQVSVATVIISQLQEKLSQGDVDCGLGVALGQRRGYNHWATIARLNAIAVHQCIISELTTDRL